MKELSGALLKDHIRKVAAEELFTGETLARSQLLQYEPGETILEAGDPLRCLMLITEGLAQVCSLSADGKLAVIADAAPPQILGDIELLQQKAALHHVRAKTPVCLVRIPIDAASGSAPDSLLFYRRLCQILMRKLYKTSHAYSQALLYPAAERLAALLLDSAQDGRIRLREKDAAERLGITPRHLRRLLSAWIEQGVLARAQPKVFLLLRADVLRAVTAGME
ncbi:MAG: Crp/Fnr family transcriptional regulator [Oscillospiraceae bacterium]|nr:Crp/Fnr family transcriptional regulator [Oscillospiraceae bacterium]